MVEIQAAWLEDSVELHLLHLKVVAVVVTSNYRMHPGGMTQNTGADLKVAPAAAAGMMNMDPGLVAYLAAAADPRNQLALISPEVVSVLVEAQAGSACSLHTVGHLCNSPASSSWLPGLEVHPSSQIVVEGEDEELQI